MIVCCGYYVRPCVVSIPSDVLSQFLVRRWSLVSVADFSSRYLSCWCELLSSNEHYPYVNWSSRYKHMHTKCLISELPSILSILYVANTKRVHIWNLRTVRTQIFRIPIRLQSSIEEQWLHFGVFWICIFLFFGFCYLQIRFSQSSAT